MEELLTIKEAGEILRLGQKSMYYYIKTAKIPVVKVGRSMRIRKRDLEKFIQPAGVPR